MIRQLYLEYQYGASNGRNYDHTAVMPKNRIRELRTNKGMSAAKLGALVGLSQAQVTRIENGGRGLSMPRAEKFAEVLETTVSEVFGLDDKIVLEAERTGNSPEIEPFEPQRGDPVASLIRNKPNISPYVVRASALDQVGIADGDILLVDITAAAVDQVKPMQCVIAVLYSALDAHASRIVLRQFIPPGMLITNSRHHNAQPLNLLTDDVHLKGVVVSIHRNLPGSGEYAA